MTLYRQVVVRDGDAEPDLEGKDYWTIGIWSDSGGEEVTLLFIEVEPNPHIRTLERQNRKLQERLNRISNAMIGNARIWELDRIAMEIGVEADIADPSLVDIDGLQADALFIRRLEWDLGELHVAVKGDTNRRGGRYDQAEWKGPRP